MKKYKYIFLLWLFVFMGSFHGWGQTDGVSPVLPLNQVGISQLKNRQTDNISPRLPYDNVVRMRNELEEIVNSNGFKCAHELANTLLTNNQVIGNTSKEFDFWPKQTTYTYGQNYPSSSSENLFADIFLSTSLAGMQSPNLTSKLSKIWFLYDFGASFIYGNDIFGIVFEFTPRINIKEGKREWSVSLGANAGVGIVSSNSGTPENSAGTFSTEFSATGRFNLGFGSKFNTKSKIGFFAGIGIGYSYLQYTQFHHVGYSQDFNNALGLLCESGINFQIDEDAGDFYGLGIKASYLVNSIKGYGNVFDLTLVISII
jgi:hypothetical protein